MQCEQAATAVWQAEQPGVSRSAAEMQVERSSSAPAAPPQAGLAPAPPAPRCCCWWICSGLLVMKLASDMRSPPEGGWAGPGDSAVAERVRGAEPGVAALPAAAATGGAPPTAGLDAEEEGTAGGSTEAASALWCGLT